MRYNRAMKVAAPKRKWYDVNWRMYDISLGVGLVVCIALSPFWNSQKTIGSVAVLSVIGLVLAVMIRVAISAQRWFWQYRGVRSSIKDAKIVKNMSNGPLRLNSPKSLLASYLIIIVPCTLAVLYGLYDTSGGSTKDELSSTLWFVGGFTAMGASLVFMIGSVSVGNQATRALRLGRSVTWIDLDKFMVLKTFLLGLSLVSIVPTVFVSLISFIAFNRFYLRNRARMYREKVEMKLIKPGSDYSSVASTVGAVILSLSVGVVAFFIFVIGALSSLPF
jgi:hypothetical protein